MTAGLLFPSDPLTARRVDGHFAAEADAVRAAGGTVALLDLEAVLAGAPDRAVRFVPADGGPYWYRGWMLRPDQYADVAAALERHGTALVVPPAQYRAAHELPGWYPTFAGVTAPSVWRPLRPRQVPSAAELAELVAPLGAGAGVVKDYVKSRKDAWAHACYVPDLHDTAHLHQVVSRFVELQDDDLAGGLVIRTFERYQPVPGGDRAAEARVWWLDGVPVLAGPHPDTPDVTPAPDLDDIAPLVAALGCRLVATDISRRVDGAWRVVEVGDGQVSDRPSTVPPSRLVMPLLHAPSRSGPATAR